MKQLIRRRRKEKNKAFEIAVLGHELRSIADGGGYEPPTIPPRIQDYVRNEFRRVHDALGTDVYRHEEFEVERRGEELMDAMREEGLDPERAPDDELRKFVLSTNPEVSFVSAGALEPTTELVPWADVREHLRVQAESVLEEDLAADPARFLDTLADLLRGVFRSDIGPRLPTQDALPHFRIERIDYDGKILVRPVLDVTGVPETDSEGEAMYMVRRDTEDRAAQHAENVKVVRAFDPATQQAFLERLQVGFQCNIDTLDDFVAGDSSPIVVAPKIQAGSPFHLSTGLNLLRWGEPTPPGFFEWLSGSAHAIDTKSGQRAAKKRHGRARVQSAAAKTKRSVAKDVGAVSLGQVNKQIQEDLEAERKAAQRLINEAQKEQRKAEKAERSAAKAAKAKKVTQDKDDQREAELAQARALRERRISEGRAQLAAAKARRDAAQKEARTRDTQLAGIRAERAVAKNAKRKEAEERAKVAEVARLAELDEVAARLGDGAGDDDPLRAAVRVIRTPLTRNLSEDTVEVLKEAVRHWQPPDVTVDPTLQGHIEDRLIRVLGPNDYGRFLTEVHRERRVQERETLEEAAQARAAELDAAREEATAAAQARVPGEAWSRHLIQSRRLHQDERLRRLKEGRLVGPAAGLDALAFGLRGEQSPWRAHCGFEAPTTIGWAFTELETWEQLNANGVTALLNETQEGRLTPDATIVDDSYDANDRRSRRPLEIKKIDASSDDFDEALVDKLRKAGKQISSGCAALGNTYARRKESGLTDDTGGIIRLVIRAHDSRPEDWEHDLLPRVAKAMEKLEAAEAIDMVDGVWVLVESRAPSGHLMQLTIRAAYRSQETGEWGDGSPFMDRLLSRENVTREIKPPFVFPEIGFH